MRVALAAVTLLAAAIPAVPASAAAGSVTVSVVGASTGSDAVGVCTAVASPPVALITLRCYSDFTDSSIVGVGAAVSVPVTGAFVCGLALAVFADGSTATGSDCLS